MSNSELLVNTQKPWANLVANSLKLTGGSTTLANSVSLSAGPGTIPRNYIFPPSDPGPYIVVSPTPAPPAGPITSIANDNIDGIGVYHQQIGATAYMRGINAASNKVSVGLDVGDDTIDIDVVPANISIQSLGNGGGAVGDVLQNNGTNFIDSSIIRDAASISSVDYKARHLVASDGVTIGVDYSSAAGTKVNNVAITGVPSAGQIPIAVTATSATWQSSSALTVQTENVYVSAQGSNVTGNGTRLLPYATIAHALTTITTNSASNQYVIKVDAGTYAETTIALKPWVSINGSGYASTVINVTNPIVLDASWNAGTSASVIELSDFDSGVSVWNIDFNANATSGTINYQNYYNNGGNMTFTGVAGMTTPLINFDGCAISNMNTLLFTDANVDGFNSQFSALTSFTITASNNSFIGYYFDSCQFQSDVFLNSGALGQNFGTFIGSQIYPNNLTANGAVVTLRLDVVSYPGQSALTILGGATLVLISQGQGLSGTLIDASSVLSVDWMNRILYDSTGLVRQLNYSAAFPGPILGDSVSNSGIQIVPGGAGTALINAVSGGGSCAFTFQTKGPATYAFTCTGGAGGILTLTNPASSVNNFTMSAATTGNDPSISVQNSGDTDVNLALLSKGAGLIKIKNQGLAVSEAANGKQGTATLVAGVTSTVTVANTSVTANSRIFVTAQDDNSVGALRISGRTPGASFKITSSINTDSGLVAYEIFEPT